jgi:exopolyphosphatase/guanosine-5'-triphosphate,3'-diphosphate pyrophosphatase
MTPLTGHQVNAQLHKLWGLSLAERKNIPGLPPNRADVILIGVAIYSTVMEEFGFSELLVSTRGLRYAALVDQYWCDLVPDAAPTAPAGSE